MHYKIDVLQALRTAGYSSYRLQKEKLLADSTLQKLRSGQTSITVENLNTICELLHCQPGDILQWSPDKEQQKQPSL